jgi:hypothetical protein
LLGLLSFCKLAAFAVASLISENLILEFLLLKPRRAPVIFTPVSFILCAASALFLLIESIFVFSKPWQRRNSQMSWTIVEYVKAYHFPVPRKKRLYRRPTRITSLEF